MLASGQRACKRAPKIDWTSDRELHALTYVVPKGHDAS